MYVYDAKKSLEGRVDIVGAHEIGNGVSIGKITRKGIRRQFDVISAAVFVQLLIHLAVAAPLVISRVVAGILSDKAALAISLGLYVFLLIPMRFWSRQKVRRVYYTKNIKQKTNAWTTYKRWLATGLLRYLRGLLWGLPFIACVVYFTVFRTILDATTFEMPVHWLAMLLANDPQTTTGNVSLALDIIMGLVALFGLLFAHGWWRDLPFEYLPVSSIGTRKTLHWSRHILKNHRGEMRANTFVNLLLCIPGFLGFAVVLGMYALKTVNFSLSIDMIVVQIRRLMTQPVPYLVLLEVLAVFAVLYLPFCIYRKCRNAALLARLMRGHPSREFESKIMKMEDEEKVAAPEEPVKTESVKQEEKTTDVKEDQPEAAKAEDKASEEKDEHAAG